MNIRALRLLPGADIKQSLVEFIHTTESRAACIVSCVGSLSEACLRYAGQPQGVSLQGAMEIISLSGTLSPSGAHLHMAIADSEGLVLGGHVLKGCQVRTTAEIIIALLPGLEFVREFDPQTGYKELVIIEKPEGADN